MTRAATALLRGDFEQAWQLHPLVYVVVPLLVAAAGAVGVAEVRRAWLPASNRRSAATLSRGAPPAAVSIGLTLLLLLTLGLWVARFFGAFGGPVPVQGYGEWLRDLPGREHRVIGRLVP